MPETEPLAPDPLTPLPLRDGSRLPVRTPGPADAAALLGYLDRVRRETPYLLWGPDEELPTLEEEENWLRSMRGPGVCQLLVEDAGEPVAMGSVRRLGPHRAVAHRADLGISVRRDRWRRGLGEALTRRLLAWATEHPGIAQVELGVFAENERAQRLYARCGFVETARLPGAFRVGDRLSDDVRMACRVGTRGGGTRS